MKFKDRKDVPKIFRLKDVKVISDDGVFSVIEIDGHITKVRSEWLES
jgi:hypothetical protein